MCRSDRPQACLSDDDNAPLTTSRPASAFARLISSLPARIIGSVKTSLPWLGEPRHREPAVTVGLLAPFWQRWQASNHSRRLERRRQPGEECTFSKITVISALLRLRHRAAIMSARGAGRWPDRRAVAFEFVRRRQSFMAAFDHEKCASGRRLGMVSTRLPGQSQSTTFRSACRRRWRRH